jgi:accessory gene regulator B
VRTEVIHRLSYAFANWIGKHTTESQPVPVMAYGIEILLNTFIQLGAILILAYWLGHFGPALAVLMAFSLLRIVSGGKHLSTFLRCTVADVILINFLAWTAVQVAASHWSIHGPLLFLLMAGTWFSVHRYAPVINPKRPRSRLQVHGRKYSKTVVLAATILAAIFYPFSAALSAAIVLGMATQGASITPVGCKAVDRLDRRLSSISSKIFIFN